jgi:uncharacterized protein
MNLYSDTSALIKKYVKEVGSDQVINHFAEFPFIGTSALTLVEMASAMSKAARMRWVSETDIAIAWRDFQSHWPAYTRLPVSNAIMERSADLSWRQSLRAYEAIHLASAVVWKDITGDEVIFACYDRNLSEAARKEGLQIWPESEF